MVSHLWVLGLLGNRGVERERIIRELSETVKAPEPEVRHWSIEALGKIGGNEVIPILTDVFRFENESLAQGTRRLQFRRQRHVRERAAHVGCP